MTSIGQVRPTECPVAPLVRDRQALPEITAHDRRSSLLHHHVRVITLHKSIGQTIGHLAHQILDDHVQNLVLDKNEVGEEAAPTVLCRRQNTSRDTMYQVECTMHSTCRVKLQEIGQAEGGTSMTCVVKPPPER